MAGPKLSIKLPSLPPYRRRLEGLCKILAMVRAARPKNYYSGGYNTPKGKEWSKMNNAVYALKIETEQFLTMVKEQRRLRANQLARQRRAAKNGK